MKIDRIDLIQTLAKLTSVVNFLLKLRLVIIFVQYSNSNEGDVVNVVSLVVYGVEQCRGVLDNGAVAGVDREGVFCLMLSARNNHISSIIIITFWSQ